MSFSKQKSTQQCQMKEVYALAISGATLRDWLKKSQKTARKLQKESLGR